MLFTSPGPDASLLATKDDGGIRTEPVSTLTPARVTPLPAPLPSAGSWIERQLQTISDAIDAGKAGEVDGAIAARNLKAQVAALPGQAQQAVEDVHTAAQLKKVLPIAVAGIGVVMGKPALGIGVGLALWWWGEQ